jgi:hypothetical protein
MNASRIVGAIVLAVTSSAVNSQAPFASAGVRIDARSPGDNGLPKSRLVAVDTDWSFNVRRLGGPFLFRVLGIPEEWMLASVQFDDKDITDHPWDVPTGGRTFEGLQVVVTRKVGRVSGTVVDSLGKATSDATVVVFSNDGDLWMPASRFVRVARPDANGRYSIVGLPAGDYCAVVQGFVELGQWEDRSFLEAARSGAVRFVLLDGGSAALTLKLPPSR